MYNVYNCKLKLSIILIKSKVCFIAGDEIKDHLHLSGSCATQTLSLDDCLFSGNEVTSSASCISDIGALSVDSDNVQIVSTSTSPQHDPVRTYEADMSQTNDSRLCRIHENASHSGQVALVGEMESCVHSSDVNVVMCTETDVPGTVNTNNEETYGGYTHEIRQMDLSGMQVEVTNHPLETSSWYYIESAFLFHKIACWCQIFVSVM
jgi:hypothetical protein